MTGEEGPAQTSPSRHEARLRAQYACGVIVAPLDHLGKVLLGHGSASAWGDPGMLSCSQPVDGAGCPRGSLLSPCVPKSELPTTRFIRMAHPVPWRLLQGKTHLKKNLKIQQAMFSASFAMRRARKRGEGGEKLRVPCEREMPQVERRSRPGRAAEQRRRAALK